MYIFVESSILAARNNKRIMTKQIKQECSKERVCHLFKQTNTIRCDRQTDNGQVKPPPAHVPVTKYFSTSIFIQI